MLINEVIHSPRLIEDALEDLRATEEGLKHAQTVEITRGGIANLKMADLTFLLPTLL